VALNKAVFFHIFDDGHWPEASEFLDIKVNCYCHITC